MTIIQRSYYTAEKRPEDLISRLKNTKFVRKKTRNSDFGIQNPDPSAFRICRIRIPPPTPTRRRVITALCRPVSCTRFGCIFPSRSTGPAPSRRARPPTTASAASRRRRDTGRRSEPSRGRREFAPSHRRACRRPFWAAGARNKWWWSERPTRLVSGAFELTLFAGSRNVPGLLARVSAADKSPDFVWSGAPFARGNRSAIYWTIRVQQTRRTAVREPKCNHCVPPCLRTCGFTFQSARGNRSFIKPPVVVVSPLIVNYLIFTFLKWVISRK